MANPQAKFLADLGLSVNFAQDLEITGLSVDSRLTKRGHLFAALPGSTVHGGEFVQFAQASGAIAILTDQQGKDIAAIEGGDMTMPFIVVDDPRAALSNAAARFYAKQPATMTAVTGTNGKTSVADFTRQIWEAMGKRAVNFGTAGVEGAVNAKTAHTTPEPITLHNLLCDLADQDVTHAAMEASSHGLEQRRLDVVYLTAAGFTNFTQDHLDYHETFEAYFNAKAALFTRVLPPEGTAVINIDDEKGAVLVDLAGHRGQDVITVGRNSAAHLHLMNTRHSATGQTIRFRWQDRDPRQVELNLIGSFQADNVLLAAALVIACGEQPDAVFDVLGELKTVSGRMQWAATRENGAPVFVDYAHTPDAVATAIQALRPHVMGRIIAIIGAGGDRDAKKRPLMGQAAAQHADVVIVTDDNPRSEDPAQIREAVMEGCPSATNIGDRAQAILTGVDALQSGDALLIAGKGHETGQTVGDDVLPFNDVEQASVAVSALDGLGA